MRAKQFCAEYGIEVPVVCAGMAFVGVPELAAAVSSAGGMGTLGAAKQPPERLRTLIRKTRALTDRPFGVNFITQFTSDADVDAAASEQVPVVSFHWNDPPIPFIKRLKSSGARVWMQVGDLENARLALDAGVDALIAQGLEAGGHNAGRAGMMALVPRLVDLAGNVPVLAAGGIADGRGLAAVLALGASGAWIGTRFVATDEAYANAAYKQKVLDSDIADTVITTMFGPEWPSQPTRVFQNKATERWAGREPLIPPPTHPAREIGRTVVAGAPHAMTEFSVMLPTPDTEGAFDEMCMVGGESAGLVREVLPAAEVVRRLRDEAKAILERLGRDPW